MVHTPDGIVYLLDIDDEFCTHSTFFLPCGDIPPEYLPGPKSFFNPNLRPERHHKDDPYYLLLNGPLHADDTFLLVRQFHQAVGLTEYLRTASGDREEHIFSRYLRGSGWTWHTFYNKVLGKLPVQNRPMLEGVHYLSPGFLRWRLNKETANLVGRAVHAVHAGNMDNARRSISTWLEQFAVCRTEIQTDNEDKMDADVACLEHINWVWQQVGVDSTKLYALTNNDLYQVAEITKNYMTRLRQLATHVSSGVLEFLYVKEIGEQSLHGVDLASQSKQPIGFRCEEDCEGNKVFPTQPA